MSLVLKRAADAFPQAGWPRSDTYWCVLADGAVVGSIRQVTGGPRSGEWLWSVSVAHPWNAGVHSGSAATLDAAKVAFKRVWDGEPR